MHRKLEELGLTLPPAPAPAADYVMAAESHGTLIISGQLPKNDDGSLLATGKVGDTVDLETARHCAARCVLNGLSVMNAALGSALDDRFEQIVRVGVFVASTPGFTEQHLVADGASRLLHEVFGEQGRHARAAVGCVSLPLDAPVEVEMTVKLLDNRFEPND